MADRYFNYATDESFPYDEKWAEVKKAMTLRDAALRLEDRVFGKGCWQESYGCHYTREYRYREARTAEYEARAKKAFIDFRAELKANDIWLYSWSYPSGHNDCAESLQRMY